MMITHAEMVKRAAKWLKKDQSCDVEIKYCPMCGRELKDDNDK